MKFERTPGLGRQLLTATPSASFACYRLPGGTVALPTASLYLRTLLGAAVWLGWPPLVMRLLARVGMHRCRHTMERWWARRVVASLRVDLDIGGLAYIDSAEQYIVVSLHEGLVDALLLLHLPLNLCFTVRDEIFDWRLVGPYLRETGQVLLSPERGTWSYRQLLRKAPAVFAAGESLVLFPQGSILGIETDFMDGAFALAQALERPILPVVLTGTHRIWEYPYSPRLRYGQRASLRVLAPIPTKSHQGMDRETLRWVVQQRMKEAALSGRMAEPRRFIPTRDGYWDGYAYQIDPYFEELAADVARHRQNMACSAVGE